MVRLVSLALLCVSMAGFADPWSIDLGPPAPWAWLRVAATPDGVGGTWVATNAGAPANVSFTHISSTGTVEYGPGQLVSENEQQPLLGQPDGEGGAIFLLEEYTSWPPVNNQLRLVRIGLDGSLRWSTLVCSTQVGVSCQRPRLALGPTSALVAWAYQTASGTEVRYQRISLSGSHEDDVLGTVLCDADHVAVVTMADSFAVAAAETTYIVKGGSSHVAWLGGVTLNESCIVNVSADGADVVGYRSGGSLVIDHRGQGTMDTVTVGLVQPIELRLAHSDGSCLISYRRDANIYGRWFNPVTATVGEELTICGAAGSQLGHQLATGSQAVGAAWVDRRSGDDRVYCQYVWPSSTRWEDGFELGEMTPFGGVVPLATCDGASAGIVVWVLPNGSLRVAIIDSHATDAAPERPVSAPSEFLVESYPNPFNASTTIRFTVPSYGPTKVEVYAVNGQHIQRLIDEPLIAGSHEVQWTPSVASGTYFVSLTTASGRAVRPVQLVR